MYLAGADSISDCNCDQTQDESLLEEVPGQFLLQLLLLADVVEHVHPLHWPLHNEDETGETLYCIGLFCTVLYCTVLYRTVLYCTALYCTVLYCIGLFCTVLYCIGLFCTVLYCTVLYRTVLYCTSVNCTTVHCTESLMNWEYEPDSFVVPIGYRVQYTAQLRLAYRYLYLNGKLIMYSVECTVYSVHFTVYILQCRVYSI